jgi:hypothetical protein
MQLSLHSTAQACIALHFGRPELVAIDRAATRPTNERFLDRPPRRFQSQLILVRAD